MGGPLQNVMRGSKMCFVYIKVVFIEVDHRNMTMIKCFLVLSLESFVVQDVSTRVSEAIKHG
jgi:hypothetical protein